MKKALGMLLVLTAFACHRPVPADVLQGYQSRTLYTCCNIHYESSEILDANFYVGSTLALGAPARVVAMTNDSVTFDAGRVKLTLYHSYGTEQESSLAYFDKVLVSEDPRLRVAGFSKRVQDAIRDGRVERGMTREQVILSLGNPPTHRTPSTSAPEWTYWYNRWVTYRVAFDERGVVSNVIGRPAPTRDEPVA